MMSQLLTGLTIPFLLAMFLAINMGGSGTAPAFSAAYGANVLKRGIIPGLFGIMVLAGALIAGKEVSLTLGKGLLEIDYFTPVNTSIILFAIGLSLLIANLIGVPQSTSQTTVLAIAGAATALKGLSTQKLFYEIIPTWIILPIISFFLMFCFSKWIVPFVKNHFIKNDQIIFRVNNILKVVLILASLYVAFAIGANNVANAAAPIASLTANEMGQQNANDLLPIIILSVLAVAPCFAIGSSLLGHKVTKKTGTGIIEISSANAMIIAIIVATLLLYASVAKGVPTSLVQLNGAAFIALSVSKKGIKKTFANATVKQFLTVWAIAPIFAFILTYLLIILFN